MNQNTIRRSILRHLLGGVLAVLLLAPAVTEANAVELTVERIDGYTYNSFFGQYEPRSTMGVMRYPGTFAAFTDQNVGRWMPSGPNAPTQYPAGTYWTFASYADLNVLRSTFTWLEFWWPTWQSTGGSGIVQVKSKGGSGNVGFGSESSGWRRVNNNRSVELRIPSIRNTSGKTSGSIRVVVAAHESVDVYRGTAGTIIASYNFSPLPKGYYYSSRVRTTPLGRTPKGRMRTAMHLMEYRNGGYAINATRTYSNIVTF